MAYPSCGCVSKQSDPPPMPEGWEWGTNLYTIDLYDSIGGCLLTFAPENDVVVFNPDTAADSASREEAGYIAHVLRVYHTHGMEAVAKLAETGEVGRG